MSWLSHPFVAVLGSAAAGAIGGAAAEPVLGLMGVVGSIVVSVGGIVAASMLWVLKQNRQAREDFAKMLEDHAHAEEAITAERMKLMLSEMRRLISEAQLGTMPARRRSP